MGSYKQGLSVPQRGLQVEMPCLQPFLALQMNLEAEPLREAVDMKVTHKPEECFLQAGATSVSRGRGL